LLRNSKGLWDHLITERANQVRDAKEIIGEGERTGGVINFRKKTRCKQCEEGKSKNRKKKKTRKQVKESVSG